MTDGLRTHNQWNHNLTMLALFLLIPIELRPQWYQRNRTVFTCETQARASSVYRLGKGFHSKLLDSKIQPFLLHANTLAENQAYHGIKIPSTKIPRQFLTTLSCQIHGMFTANRLLTRAGIEPCITRLRVWYHSLSTNER